ncbi:MAG: glycosyltransferase, partial [Flavobacteriaceae bacterium]|nr:glycosyltransferase [Flavobacteriaceae bacterium]
KLLFNIPRLIKVVKKEQQVVAKIIKKEGLTGLISDNRFGVYSKKIPSVYITHQVNVLSGFFTFLTSKIHQRIIAKFDECWILDYKGENNLAGRLSQTNNSKANVKYIGPISRLDIKIPSFEGGTNKKRYDLLVLLSGPEPQRSLLEEKLLEELKSYSKSVLFIRGIISDKEKENQEIILKTKNIKFVNFMLQNELQGAINESELLIARSGYSTIMDLESLKAKVFFIPTPGQYEQEYLAKYLEIQNIAPYTTQNNFDIKMLEEVKNYTGFRQKKMVKENRFSLTIFK